MLLTVPRADHGPVTIEAEQITPGLYIHATIRVEDDRPATDQWRLAHHSGRMIAYFPTKQLAREAGLTAASFADWTRSADELAALSTTGDIDLALLAHMVGCFGGTFVRRSDASN